MSTVTSHYNSAGPVARVAAALAGLAPDGAPLTADQVAGLEDFHTAGRFSTTRVADLLAPGPDDTVLDAGSGIGGPARFLARTFGCRVIGIDLTPEFVEIAAMIGERIGETDRVEFRVGDITRIDLPDASVDHAWTQHVAMNIADRPRLYSELRRVLRPGGRLAVFDVIDGEGGDLLLPVPWATEAAHSHLVTRDEQRELLEAAGFRIDVWEDPTADLVGMMKVTLGAAPSPADGPPPLSPGLLFEDFQVKGQRYLQNMDEGRTALVLAVGTAI